MTPTFVQVIIGVLALGGSGGAIAQLVNLVRERRHGAPMDETAARLDIVKQLETERGARAAVEHERDDANARAAREGRRADAADARADRLELYISELREDCLAHGTPLTALRPRPIFVGAPT